MKKLFVCMLVFTLVLIGLIACGNRNSGTTTTTVKPTSSSSSSATTTTTALTTTTKTMYTITFEDPNGDIIDAYVVGRGELVEAPDAPTISGKRFLGYYDENGEKFDENKVYDASLTFKARYETTAYIITFTGEGVTTFTRSVTPGTKPYLLPAAPERLGYVFIGWYCDGQPYNFNADYTRSLTLVAQWIEGYIVTFVDEQNNVITQTTAREGCGVAIPAGTSSYYYVPVEKTALMSITEDTTITLKKVNYPSGTYQTSLGMIQSSNYTKYFSTTGRVYSYATTLGADQSVTFTGKFVGGITFYIGGEKIGKDQSMTVEVLLDGEVVNRLTFCTTARDYLTVAATETYGTHTVTIRVVEMENISSSGGTGTSVLVSECKFYTKNN